MSSPCLSGGGRSYGFELERVKSSPSAASTATAAASAITSSLTSSPSSTLSESGNSPLAISTRKPRTTRKRPNQTYNEAAALLSTVYPNIFSTITNHHKFTTPGALLLDQPSDLLLSPFPVFDTPGFLLHHQYHYRPIEKPDEPRLTNLTIPSYQSCGEVDSPMGTTDSTNSMEVCEEEDDLDTGSILDEEIGEGIDSIMGNLSVGNEMAASGGGGDGGGELNSWRSMGYNFGGKFQPGIRAFRNLEERNWWCFPIVDMLQISPRLSSNNNGEQEKEKEKEKNSTRNSNSNTNPKLKPEADGSEKRKKKKKKKVEKAVVAEVAEEVEEVGKNWSAAAQADKQSLLLKLNYKEVLDAWSDRGSPYSDQGLGSDGKDASARLALIDLFSEGGGGMREASVLRYKEKRRTRLFSKKIRYQVRKVNADRRPRMKGRFIRRLSSSSSGQRREK